MTCGCVHDGSGATASCLKVRAGRVGGISGSASRIGGLEASAVRIGGLKVTASLICTLDNYYLRVNPDVLWVSEEDIRQMLIESNTEWNIE